VSDAPMTPRLFITGASSFVARQIVPSLITKGVDIILLSRDPAVTQEIFPGAMTHDYAALDVLLQPSDMILHLATLNNDSDLDLETFRAVNVDFLQEIMNVAGAKKISRFIYASSLHALETPEKGASHYATSKAEGEALLLSQTDVPVTILSLAAIYGADFSGNLKILDRLPRVLRGPGLGFLSALKPTLHADILVNAIVSIIQGDTTLRHILANGQSGNLTYRIFQRLMNILFAFLVFGLLWWLLLSIWLWVRVSSPGPGILAQDRVGKNGSIFVCYKFRTMHQDTKNVGTHEADRSSITSPGVFLRKTKIDELPQIVNLMKGELSLIGPRPCLPVQEELITCREEAGIFDVLPGISGWAQINDVDMSDAVRLTTYDSQYIVRQSILFDLKIVLLTFIGRGQGDKIAKEPSGSGV